jgi:uncharacterized protein (UPF0548 family)
VREELDKQGAKVTEDGEVVGERKAGLLTSLAEVRRNSLVLYHQHTSTYCIHKFGTLIRCFIIEILSLRSI